MNLNISLNDAMWWENLHPDHAILLYKYTKRAYDEDLEYYVQGPGSGEVELTKIYEQFKLLATLRAEHQ